MDGLRAFHSKYLKASVAAISILLTFSSVSRAADTLYFAGFGGVIEEVFRKEVLPPFEQQYNVKVEYIPAVSASLLARLRAQKDNPELDLVQLDSGPQRQAIELDLCAIITDQAILNSALPSTRWAGDKAVTWSIVSAGLVYNKRYFDEKGWAAPTSWNDLRDPKFLKKIMLPTFSTEFGVYAISMLARANGGNDDNADVAFNILSKEVGPNVLSFDPGPGKAAELYQTEQAVFGVWSMPRVTAMRAQGFPLVFVYPKEGAVASPEHACIVKKPKPNPLTEKLLAYLMSPPAQIILARSLGMTPGNKDVELPADVAPYVLTGEAALKKLVNLDYTVINAHRDEWFKRWQREVER